MRRQFFQIAEHALDDIAAPIDLLIERVWGRPATVARFDLTEGDRAIVEAGIRATLIDPQSAEFGLMVGTSGSDGAMTVCGTVNAKSGSRGGYTGNQMFIGLLRGNSTSDLHPDGDGPTAARTITSLCPLQERWNRAGMNYRRKRQERVRSNTSIDTIRNVSPSPSNDVARSFQS